MIWFMKIESKIMKMTWKIRLFTFCMILIFLNVMVLQFSK